MAAPRYLGPPPPRDPLGGASRSRTDHDEAGLATRRGPRAARPMVKALAEEAIRIFGLEPGRAEPRPPLRRGFGVTFRARSATREGAKPGASATMAG